MKLHVTLVAIFVIALVASPTYGFSASLDDEFDDSYIDELKEVWAGINVTDVKRVLENEHPHTKLDTPEVAQLYEYVTETHTVDSDGYLLTVHRITGNKTHPSPQGKPAVLLMHGLLCSSMDWVLAGPKRGLAFLLADAGYDVWLGNVRGNKYSRKHKSLGTSTKKYWSFSWHEMGMFDLPAMIDYIIENTGNKKIFYAGHSQGTTSFFVMSSERPEYNDKIEAMFSLAPVTYSKNLFSPFFKYLSKLVNHMKRLTDIIGLYEFIPNGKILRSLANKVCNSQAIPAELCVNIIFVFTGFNKEQFDMELLPVILNHVPAGASMYQIYHYAQLIKSGKFRQFDYGWWGNIKKYKWISPPEYKVNKCSAPIYLHYSNNDWLSHPTDVKTLHSQLPNCHKLSRVPDDKFNHLDFLWAKDVKTLLYEEVIGIMEERKIKMLNSTAL